ncbi:MAG: sulfatase [Planctomycetota bacterium]|jgi:uncharacterized sulfatase|nr:sulfatase [Planctomycetota bacterium]
MKCVFVGLVSIFATLALTAQDKPNIVLIISDDQAWTDFGFMGHEVVETPHLDRLASQSAVFPRGYVPSSLCRTSLASIITGLYPHQHGITGNDPRKGVSRHLMLEHIDRAATLPKILGPLGYRSLQTGKWWEGHHRRGGFTDGMTHGDPARRGRHGDEGLKVGRESMQPINDFLDDCKEKQEPFFVWYAPFLPHTPHNPPERLLEKYRAPDRSAFVAKYYAMCEWFDETCGQLLAALDSRDLTENTLVLFVVDNGWIQKPDRRGFAARSKRSPYDGGLRTPIMVRWPGKVSPGEHQKPVSSIDLAPTILKACGAEVPDGLPGLDLISMAREEGDEREAIFGATFDHDVADLHDPAESLQFRWTVAGRFKLIQPADSGVAGELFDLLADPHEKRDLAADSPDQVARLRALLDAWWPGTSDN